METSLCCGMAPLLWHGLLIVRSAWTEGQHPHAILLKGLGQDTFKGLVIAILLEESMAGHGAVEYLVDEAARSIARTSWHAQHHTPRSRLRQVKSSRD